MPANLPPKYHEAENRYRAARTIPEKVAALQEMLALMPKHKGTDHLKADLRARIAKLIDDLNVMIMEEVERQQGGSTT